MTTSDALHPLDAAIGLEPVDPSDPSRLRGSTTPEYWNMVGPFGGTTAAVLLRAVLQQPNVHGEPITLTVNYAGPVAEGEFEVSVEAVRTNRSNQHWVITQTQGEQVCTTATAVTAVRKETWTDSEAQVPVVPPAESIEPSPDYPGIAWNARYEQRMIEGGIPSETDGESDSSRTTFWVRDNPPRPVDVYSVTSQTDTLYPRAFLRKGTFLPAGTVSITIHYLADLPELEALGEGYSLVTGAARRFGRSYFDQTSEVWSAHGKLLATAHQMVYFKA